MAAAYHARRKQRSQCPQDRIGPQSRLSGVICFLVWAGVWLWFGARTFRLGKRILACQQFSCACLHTARFWQNLERLQWR